METLLTIGVVVILAGLAVRLVSTSNKHNQKPAETTPAETVQEIAAAAEVEIGRAHV